MMGTFWVYEKLNCTNTTDKRSNDKQDAYPWIQIPAPCRSFSLKTVWDGEQEALVNSFFVQLGVSELNVLEWHGDCFSFCPKDFGKLVNEYHDDERNCNVYFPSYYPNGDYNFL